jgi:acyl-CoA thioesterase-1
MPSRIVSIRAPEGSVLVTERSSMLAGEGMRRRMYRKAWLLATFAVLAASAAAPREKVVVFLGDSLTAGYGLPADQAFPSILEKRLRERGTRVRAVNAGVSGDTSAGALRRLPWVLRQKPDVVVVELGANDALRGQPPAGIEANLRAITEQARASGARVLLVGMRIPTSYGRDYADEVEALYPRLAKSLDVPLVPFLLEGVAGRPGLNLGDGIHPNAEGQKIVAANVLPHLEGLLR